MSTLFPRLLQSDQLVSGDIYITPYTIGSGFKSIPGATFVQRTLPKLGSKSSTQCGLRVKWDRKARFHPPKPIVHQKLTASCTNAIGCVMSYAETPKGVIYREVYGPVAAGPGVFDTEFRTVPVMDNRALAAFVTANAKANAPAMDAGMMLAEATETISMLASPFNALPKLLKAMKHPRRTVSLAKKAAYAADSWLTARFGILPLLSDIDTIRNMTVDKLSQDSPLRSNVHVQKEIVSDTTTPIRGLQLLNGVYGWGSTHTVVANTVHAKVYYSSSMRPLNADLGIDLSNLPSMIWNKIPLSFVVDWSVGVGDWLQAITPKPGINSLGSCVGLTSYKHSTTHIWGISASSTVDAAWPMTPVNSWYESMSSAYQRFTDIGLPRFPVVSLDFTSWKHVVDSLTLSYQRFKF